MKSSRRSIGILALVAAQCLLLQAPAEAFQPATFDLPALVEAIVNQCAGFKGHKICDAGERLGAGLVCPPDPIGDDGIDKTTPDCPFRARGQLAGDIKIYFEAQVEINIDLKVTGTKKKLKADHVHRPNPRFPEAAKCSDTPTLESSLVDVTSKVSLKATAGNAAAEAKAEIEAELKALQADYCRKGKHPPPLQCQGEEIRTEVPPGGSINDESEEHATGTG